MTNWQKFTRQSFPQNFLLAVFLQTVIFTQIVFNQGTEKLFPKNENIQSIRTSVETTTVDFTTPFKNCWNISDSKILSNKIASDNTGSLVVSFLSGKISLINTINTFSGEKIWESDLGGEIISVPYIENENIYVITKPTFNLNTVGTGDIANDTRANYLTLRSLNKESGITNWQTKILTGNISGSESGWELLHIFKSSLLVFNNKGTISAFNTDNGEPLWSIENKILFLTSPFFVDDRAIFAASDGQIIFVSLLDGSIIKRVYADDERYTAIYYDKERENVILGGQKGDILLINIRDVGIGDKPEKKKKAKVKWKFRNGAEVTDISLTTKGILASSLDNFIYLISDDNGELIWKRRLNGRISAKPLVLDDYAVVTTVAEPVASIIDLDNGRLVNKITLTNDNFFIERPILIEKKLMLTTQQGVFAFSSGECSNN